MTKFSAQIGSEKVAPAPDTQVIMPQQAAQPQQAPQSCALYVLSILATIFCCLPCGAIGLVHIMIGNHEAEKGNHVGAARRKRQATCWTAWSIALGLLFFFFFFLAVFSLAARLEWRMEASMLGMNLGQWGDIEQPRYDWLKGDEEWKDYPSTGRPPMLGGDGHDNWQNGDAPSPPPRRPGPRRPMSSDEYESEERPHRPQF